MGTTEGLLGRKSSGSGLENRDYDSRDLLRWPCDTPLSAKVGTNFANKQWLPWSSFLYYIHAAKQLVNNISI
jgi:hypothetical protein